MGLTHSPLTPTNGLVLCLDSANRRSYPGTGTSWRDLSGNGNDGTLTNGVTYSGQGMSFDGVNDYIDNSKSFFGLNDYTVSCWFLYRSTSTVQSVVSHWQSGQVGRFSIIINYNRLTGAVSANELSIIYGAATGLGTGLQDMSTNRWYNIVVSASASTLRLFVNGNQTSSATPTGSLPNTPIQIGRLSSAISDYYFNGLIDDVRFYNRALTVGEILALYNYKRKFFTQ